MTLSELTGRHYWSGDDDSDLAIFDPETDMSRDPDAPHVWIHDRSVSMSNLSDRPIQVDYIVTLKYPDGTFWGCLRSAFLNVRETFHDRLNMPVVAARVL